MSQDRLDKLFLMREEFMHALKEKYPENNPSWPVDLGSKNSQQHIRDMALRGVEEMFEALQHLKNWKPHRDTEIKDFDREEFLEEVVDSFNYFLSVLVLMGFSSSDLFSAYVKKNDIIHHRIKSDY